MESKEVDEMILTDGINWEHTEKYFIKKLRDSRVPDDERLADRLEWYRDELKDSKLDIEKHEHCFIEAMKIKNKRIAELAVENAELVEDNRDRKGYGRICFVRGVEAGCAILVVIYVAVQYWLGS